MNSSPLNKKPETTSIRIVPFVVAQLCIVGIAIAGISWRSQQLDRRAQLPPLRELPLEVAPQFDDPRMVNDDDLRDVLRKLRPQFQGTDTKIAHVDHNLRFWGAEARFDDPRQYVSGQQMRELLLDHRAFAALYGDDTAQKKPLLLEVDDQPGIRIRELDGPLSASHDDHTLACLSEVGTPLNYPVVTPQRQATFRDIVEQSIRDFSLNQLEYEWSALTYALFFDRVNRWVSSEGQEISFDLLAERIMRQPMPQGVCMGNHRLHALVVLLRVHEDWDGPEPLLSQATHDRIVVYLQDKSQRLKDHQHPDGFWNIDWYTRTPESAVPTQREGDGLGDRIIATGHALEWWALLPKDPANPKVDKYGILPPHDTLETAARWLVTTIKELDESRDNNKVIEYNSFLSHAGRALALWRGKFPYQVNLTLKTQGE